MLIPDQWYAACTSSQLAADAPRPAQIGEHKLVVFRDADGRARTLLDRCCHRGVRLSLGKVRGGRIACRYHGWEYDGSGKLTHVPSLGSCATPPAHAVDAYPSQEVDHYVWVWIAGRHPEPSHAPGLKGLCDGVWVQYSGVWDCNVMPAVENQLDIAHTKFSHPGIYPGHTTQVGEAPPLQELRMECCSNNDSVDAYLDGAANFPDSGNVDDILARFELPYRNYVFLEADNTRAIYNWVPLANNRCRLEFMGHQQTSSPTPGSSGVRVIGVEQEIELLAQDRILLESAQAAFDEGIESYERSVVADAPPLMARKLAARALRGELNPSDTAHGRRRKFTCWA